MNTIKEILLYNWTVMRWIRLGLGIFIAVQAIQHHDVFSGFIAAFFLFQAATNTGCCGVNTCEAPQTKKESNKIEDISFEEIKTK